MLFNYQYIAGHDIEKYQSYSDFLFLKVWSRARTPFDSSKLDRMPLLKLAYESFDHIEDEKSFGYKFNLQIERIYGEFLKISKSARKKLRYYYRLNNRIETLFSDVGMMPISYATLDVEFPNLSKELKKFYRSLYGSESAFLLKDLGFFNEVKKKHYKAFFKANFEGGGEGLCPFCGLNAIRGNDHDKLEAYDHLIPKGKYPFNSINFKNLAIMCNECNSSYKQEHTILFTKTVPRLRRVAFYPYSSAKWTIAIGVSLSSAYHRRITKSEISITATCSNRSDETVSWMETFEIQERYRAKLLGEFAGRHWFDKFQNGIRKAREIEPGLTPKKWAERLINECKEKPLAEHQFLKMPFYQECLRLLP